MDQPIVIDDTRGFCHDEFWNLNLTWYTDNPDFTLCFHSTALVYIPAVYLWLFLPGTHFEQILLCINQAQKFDFLPKKKIKLMKIQNSKFRGEKNSELKGINFNKGKLKWQKMSSYVHLNNGRSNLWCSMFIAIFQKVTW